jgi:hypothetical protein
MHFNKGYVQTGELILKDKGLQGRLNVSAFMAEYEEYAEDFLY